MTDANLRALLREGIAAAKAAQPPPTGSRIRRLNSTEANQRQKATTLLRQVIEQDPSNIPAWLWLSTVVTDPRDKRLCLENVLHLEPGNRPAKQGLAHLDHQATLAPPAPPKPAAPQEPCPFCHKPISTLATTCEACHLSLVIDCPVCGNRVDVEQSHCPQCDHSLGDYRDSAPYFAGLAAAYQAHNQPKKAITAWQTVQQFDPGYPHLHLRLGQLLGTDGRTDAAISALHLAMKQKEDELTAMLALATIFQQLHRWDEAAPLFRKLLAAAPEAPESHFALGWFHMEQGQLKQAETHLRQATKLDPQHGQAWLRLAQLYDHLGRRKQAARAYQQAAHLLSTNTIDNMRAQRRLDVLTPALPTTIGSNWGELIRQMAGPIMLCGLAALLDAGLRPWWIPLTGWLAIFLAGLGAFLWVSGSSLPRNPLLQLLLGEPELASPTARQILTVVGLVCWFVAFGIILFPINQTFPEIPAP